MRNLVTLFIVAAACSPAAGNPRGLQEGEPIMGSCTEENLTMPCSCGDENGRQVCVGGSWSTCECAGAMASSTGGAAALVGAGSAGTSPRFDGNLRTDITFQWQSTAAPV